MEEEAEILAEGILRDPFSGFKDWQTEFQFRGNGGTWRQEVFKYHYRNTFSPRAKVIRQGGGCYLVVECMNDSVEVRRVGSV